MAHSRPRLFVNPSGQADNIGDSLLRRGFLDSVRPHADLHVLLTQGDSYNSGLGLQPADVGYRSRTRWALAAALGRGRRVLAYNPGEIDLGGRFAAKARVFALLAAIVRGRGGAFVLTGVGVRHPEATDDRLLALVARADLVTWRDPASARAYDDSVALPDWAFALPGSGAGDGDRKRAGVAVAIRGDRPYPPAIWVEAVRRWAAGLGVPLTVCVQVRRDNDAAQALAADLGAELLPWPAEASHADQEAVLRQLYARTRFVVSDRMHVLVAGMTEGARPIGFTPGAKEKMERALQGVTGVACCASAAEFATQDDAVEWLGSVAGSTADTREELASAKASLSELGERIGRLADRGHAEGPADE